MRTKPQRYTMDQLFLYSYLFKRSKTFFGRLSVHELHVWVDALYDLQSKLAHQTDATLGEAAIACKERISKPPKATTHEFVGTSLPEKLRLLQPSAQRQASTTGILKAPRSSNLEESAICSTHERQVAWGVKQVQHIDKTGTKPVRQKPFKNFEDRKKRLLLQNVLEKDAQFYQQQLSSDPRFTDELDWYEAKDLFVELVKYLPSVGDVIKGILEHQPNLKLYHASCVLLSVRWLDFQLRLFIHGYFALTESDQENAAYHADIALELVLRASDIPLGSLSKHNLAVNSASNANLPEELKNTRKILQLANQGQRVHVHWKRLAEDSEARRLYTEDSEDKNVVPQDTNNTSKQASKTSKPSDAQWTSGSPLSLVRLMGR
ncbi:hypothetical protein KCU99_g7272, partial [Aureobasidium melanogenum]